MKPKKVLVVEDDKVTRTLMGAILSQAGYEVVYASTATQAVQVAREENPHLITLDINLDMDSPGDAWDGFTVAGWLKRLNESTPVPIIIVSGADPSKIIGKASEVGAYTLLSKPVEKASLLAAVAGASGLK